MATTSAPQTPAADWTVAYGTPSGMIAESTVTAAYFKEDGRLTVFKDDSNRAVYAVRTDTLVSIERARIADPIMAAFRQALQQANEEEAPATVGFRNGTTDETGLATETGYDITVAHFNGTSPAA